ncbi:ATP-binding protein [Fodinicurvata halophila]|uniref:histidine kinase n=1 Tax=Fodinicurvata halophila TaxID=1419723 RepID=A0ABV8UMN1_9PROT
MSVEKSTSIKNSENKSLSLGVGTRLLIAFFGITTFAVLAAVAGIYAFQEVGHRLDVIDRRVTPALSALELSRTAERIIAVAPALLATTERPKLAEIRAELTAESGRLNDMLLQRTDGGAGTLPSQIMEPIVSSLANSLAELDELVAQRIESNEKIGMLRGEVFRTSAEVQRLLGPWLQVVDSEISMIVEKTQEDPTQDRDRFAQQLVSLIQTQRLVQSVRQQVSTVVDMLTEASTTEHTQRLPILEFQLGLALTALAATSEGLGPGLQPLFQEQLARLRNFIKGPNAIANARAQEIQLVEEGKRQLAETERLSMQLTAAVDQAGYDAKQDIGTAIRDALQVQRLSAQVLLFLVVLSLFTSVLIVWFYVGGNIVRRLSELTEGMRAIAEGHLHTAVEVKGNDEITEMSRTVEILRHNTLERDALLSEKLQVADYLEREVKQRTAELELANSFKSRFLASASHDLRQPLHALNLFMAQLRAEADPVKRSHLVTRIDASVISMNELFEELLDTSKLEAGILAPDLKSFPAEHLLMRLETTFAGVAHAKGLRLRIVPSSAWVRSDVILLERILLNLVSNAIRYTEKGSVVIGCRPRGQNLRFDVWDSGPGIPYDQQKTIFNEFYQLAPRRADRQAGLGLGLAIVERFARLLGHSIELSSQPGQGTRFSIFVPRTRAGLESASYQDMPRDLADPLVGKCILLIDDDEVVLSEMGGLLGKLGCTILTAPSSGAAVEQLERSPTRLDLIISDYRLTEGRSGPEAIALIRQVMGNAVPALLITGDTTPEVLHQAQISGYHLLHKPVTPMALRSILTHLIGAGPCGTERPTHGKTGNSS